MSDESLRDFGERRLVEEVLRPRYSSLERSFGDDCATIEFPSEGKLVVTTDPCPPPMAHFLGFSDEYYRGWLLATINLSDLAAAGAFPLGIVTSLMLPPEQAVSDLRRLLDGIDECCAEAGVPVIGGNLKEAPKVDVQATAFGAVHGEPLSRTGCKPGDAVVLAGPAGEFWAGALLQLRGGNVAEDVRDQLLRTVLTPLPQIAFGRALQGAGVRCAVMDNSDGLGPALATLAQYNTVRIEVDLTELRLSDEVVLAASAVQIESERMLFGWGDWDLVCCIDPRRLDEVEGIAAEYSTRLTRLGTVSVGSGVEVRRGADIVPLEAPDSERFVADSWFVAGVEAYVERLTGFVLP